MDYELIKIPKYDTSSYFDDSINEIAMDLTYLGFDETKEFAIFSDKEGAISSIKLGTFTRLHEIELEAFDEPGLYEVVIMYGHASALSLNDFFRK